LVRALFGFCHICHTITNFEITLIKTPLTKSNWQQIRLAIFRANPNPSNRSIFTLIALVPQLILNKQRQAGANTKKKENCLKSTEKLLPSGFSEGTAVRRPSQQWVWNIGLVPSMWSLMNTPYFVLSYPYFLPSHLPFSTLWKYKIVLLFILFLKYHGDLQNILIIIFFSLFISGN